MKLDETKYLLSFLSAAQTCSTRKHSPIYRAIHKVYCVVLSFWGNRLEIMDMLFMFNYRECPPVRSALLGMEAGM